MDVLTKDTLVRDPDRRDRDWSVSKLRFVMEPVLTLNVPSVTVDTNKKCRSVREPAENEAVPSVAVETDMNASDVREPPDKVAVSSRSDTTWLRVPAVRVTVPSVQVDD